MRPFDQSRITCHGVRRLALIALVALAVARARAAEFTTDHEGAPAITQVKLMRNAHLGEWWAWVTFDHEDWPIETRRFKLPDKVFYPYILDGHRLLDEVHDRDRIYTRDRRWTHPYRHFVDWWVIVGPKNEKIHKRVIDRPHPSGWPFKLLERGIKIPIGITQVTFKAHDRIHGESKKTITVDILQQKGPGWEVESLPPPPLLGIRGAAKRHFRSIVVRDVPDLW